MTPPRLPRPLAANGAGRLRFPGESAGILIALSLIALASCFAYLRSVNNWTDDFRRHIPALDNLKQARNGIIKGYLFAQLARNQNATVASEDALALVDQAILDISDCRDGRSTLSDFDGLPTENPELAQTLDQYAKTASRFRDELSRQLADNADDPDKSSLALRPILHDLTRLADQADRSLHLSFRRQLNQQQEAQQLQLALWLAFLGVLGGVLLLAGRARRRANEALRRSEEDLHITMQSIGDAVIVTDAGGLIRNMNPVAELLTGWPLAEAAGRPLPEVFRIVNAETRQAAESPVEKVLQEGRIVGLANHTVLICRDRCERQIADSGAPIRNAAGTMVGVVLVFRDVTEQYRLEEELRQAQKLEAVGRLAGGVAHDFNNALTAILGGAQLLREHLPAAEHHFRYVTMIESAAEHAAQLTRQLLAFSRKGNMQTVAVDLNGAVRNVCLMLEHSIDKRIEIACDLAPGPAMVTGDPAQLETAILNLAVNARDAMPGGGRLRFSTRITEVTVPHAASERYPVPAGMYAELSVSDTGTGIVPEVLPHIFDPFFTTKEVGRGTGLGLPAVYGTMKQHAGAVCVSSNPGQGSTFRLLIPLTDDAPRNEAPPAIPGAESEHTILIIEDDPLIRELAQELLTGIGYRVCLADDGEAGMRALQERAQEVDLIVLDLIMPKAGGEDVFPILRRIAPQVPILIASGYGEQEAVQNLIGLGAAGFLRKPYTIAELSQAIADILRKES